METTILVAFIAAISASIVGPIVNALINRKKRHNEHDEKESDEMIKWRKKVDTCLDEDKDDIKTLNKGVNALSKLNLAMASHMLDGNNTVQLKEARDYLQDYLIER